MKATKVTQAKAGSSRSSYYTNIQDFLTVSRGTWFLILINLLAMAAFLGIAQGQDTLLLMTEQVGRFNHLPQLGGMLAALFFWSISSEYGTRMLIYLTDNSGHSLDPVRVNNRKKYQRWIAKIALFYPPLLMICAIVKVYVSNYHGLSISAGEELNNISYGSIIILITILLEIWLIFWLYQSEDIDKGSATSGRSRIFILSKRHSWLSWMAISNVEHSWADKLYGILNDIRVDIPKTFQQFKGPDLPRGVLLPNGMQLPDSANIYSLDGNPEKTEPNLNIWMFRIRPQFYRCLLQQLLILLVISTGLILCIGFLFSVDTDISLSAAVIICFAFAAWQIVYVFFHFLDKAQPIPFRFILFCWLIICSIINNDHPVRILAGKSDNVPTLQDHFGKWLMNAQRDKFMPEFYRVPNSDSIPVIFVSAEGGALRTGAFTGLLLAHLQDRYPMFRNYLYAYSSVSGGTVGSNFFNAQLITNGGSPAIKHSWRDASKRFFETDFLSAVTAKLCFSEIVNYFWPKHIDEADRAIAIEESFETGWQNAYPSKPNELSLTFNNTIATGSPALFINTTEVETGLQNIWSNVSLNGLPLAAERDLRAIENTNLRYSTAINLSDRFPLVSPAGAFFRHDKNGNIFSRHFVDGGYYENKGSETLLQVLKALNIQGLRIKPYILQFNFSGDTVIHSVTKFNEINEIVSAIYNTRTGRGEIAQDALKAYVDSLHGVFIPLNLSLNEKELPLNWVLSETAVNRLDHMIDVLVNTKVNPAGMASDDHNELQKLFFYHPEYKRSSKKQ